MHTARPNRAGSLGVGIVAAYSVAVLVVGIVLAAAGSGGAGLVGAGTGGAGPGGERPGHAAADRTATTLRLGLDSCGSEWRAPRGGAQHFVLTNITIAGMEVYLQNASTKAVYLDVESLGSGASLPATVTLGDGRYRFVCLPADNGAVLGPVARIADSGVTTGLTPGIVPVTANDLLQPSKKYTAWITAQLPTLVSAVTALNGQVAAGDLPAARRAWLTAHLEYERLGAAYGAFGELDAEINGLPALGATAATDAGLGGFHRVEAMLWSGYAASAIAPVTERLLKSVRTLQATFATVRIDPLEIGLRAHEILENAVQFELTGRADAGSGTDLATVSANIDGTRAALAPLREILATRYPELAKTDAWLTRSAAVVASFHRKDGSWAPVESLSRSDRERLNATLGETVELLAPIASICDIRRAT